MLHAAVTVDVADPHHEQRKGKSGKKKAYKTNETGGCSNPAKGYLHNQELAQFEHSNIRPQRNASPGEQPQVSIAGLN